MPERFRSPASRDMVRALRRAGATVVRAGHGKFRVSGPAGSLTVFEPGSETRRDLRRNGVLDRVRAATGITVTFDD
jgi:hypothetical protein